MSEGEHEGDNDREVDRAAEDEPCKLCKEFIFYSECNIKPLVGFKQSNDMI